jgi:hypothetical protein
MTPAGTLLNHISVASVLLPEDITKKAESINITGHN